MVLTLFTYAVQEVPRSLSGSFNSLERLTELYKTVGIMVVDYYSKIIQIKITNGIRHIGQWSRRISGMNFQFSPKIVLHTALTSFINDI